MNPLKMNGNRTARRSAGFIAASLLTTSLSLGTSGCITKDLQEMHDSTVEMNKKMDATNAGVARTAAITCATLAELRKGASSDKRREDFKQVLEAKEIAHKLAAASTFIQSFEAELYQPICDAPEYRDTLLEEGVKEYFRLIAGLAKKHNDVGPISQSNRMQALYAVTGALHYKNSLQDAVYRDYGIRPLSMLELIVAGLRKDKEIKEGKVTPAALASLPQWVREVRIREQDAHFVLRVRHNFSMGYAYALLASDENGDEPGFWDRAMSLVFNGFFGRTWDSVIEQRNDDHLAYIALVLRNSVEARDVLREIGQDPKTSGAVLSILKHLRRPVAQSNPSTYERARAEQIAEINRLLDRLLDK